MLDMIVVGKVKSCHTLGRAEDIDRNQKIVGSIPFLRPWHLSCLALSLSVCRGSRLGSNFSKLEGNSAGPHPHINDLLGLCSA